MCLLSERTLKKMSRRLTDNDGLDNSAYLRLRASKLDELERTVDSRSYNRRNIYVAKRIEYSAAWSPVKALSCFKLLKLLMILTY